MTTQGDKLSKRHTRDGGGKSINTEEAKIHDVKVKDVMEKVFHDLQLKYPDQRFTLRKTILQSEIASIFNPHLSTEAKKQGTNHTRCEKGLKKQAMGNAIERAHKNYNEIKNLFDPYPYTGYILFGYGCDFQQGSSIVDRLNAMTFYDRFNVLHIKDTIKQQKINGLHLIERHKKASVFLQVAPFTFDFLYHKTMEAAEIALSFHL